MNEEQFFADLANEMVADHANQMLDTQVERVRTWERICNERGQIPTLRDLIVKVLKEPSIRHHVLAAYAAALWRFAHEEDHELSSKS